jgi:hypothetical protein
MQESTARGIQVAAHLAIIFTAVLISTVVIKNYVIGDRSRASELARSDTASAAGPGQRENPGRRPPSTSQIKPGTKLEVPEVNWNKNGQTLILALSENCKFCTESAPFYQRLVKERGKTSLVAVLPQPVEQGRKYLESLGVDISDVRQVSFPAVGLRGTPTLILADNNGVAIESWIGKLPANREEDVLGRLR